MGPMLRTLRDRVDRLLGRQHPGDQGRHGGPLADAPASAEPRALVVEPMSQAVDQEPYEPVAYLEPQQNRHLALDEYKRGVTRVQSTPYLLTIESTSRCNLRCVMCPHAIDAVDRPKNLEDDLAKKLDGFVQRADAIQLHGIGEPLASPAFWKLLDSLPIADLCDSSINTNFTVLSGNRMERLVTSNLKSLNISLDAATAATYQKIRGFDFEVVVSNIAKFIAARNAAGRSLPAVYMNMTLMRANIEEAAAYVRLAAELKADKVAFWHLNRYSEDEMRRHVVERDGWRFSYDQEGLWNFPALSNKCLKEAQAEAAQLNMPLALDINKSVYFDE